MNTFFVFLVKERPTRGLITELYDGDGIVVSLSVDLMRVFNIFTSKLYVSPVPNTQRGECSKKLLSHIQCKFPRVAWKVLEAPITEEELIKVVQALVKGKNLGPDGFMVDFLKIYWDFMSANFTLMMNKSLGWFLNGVTQGFITLFFKEGDILKLTNWRPITMLNTTCKIFAKALQRRFQASLVEVIDSD